MNFAPTIRTVVASAVLLLLVGCLAPPKKHAWQISQEQLSEIQGAEAWPQVSTNDYARVPDSNRGAAVALLQDQPFLALDASQLSTFAPSLSEHSGAKPYLVRGVSFLTSPAFTIVRFDAPTGRLFIQQATYDGEMIMPFRWAAEPNALVVFLPRAPEHVYPHPLLGGDWIFRGKRNRDSR